MNENTKARAAVLIGNFFFGTSVIAVKYITPSLMAPIALTAVRIGVTTLLFWISYAVNPVKTGISKKDYLLLAFCALAGIALNQTFSMRGMSLTSPVHASLLILITPVTITLLAVWFLNEKLNGIRIGGLLLGISGGALLVFTRDISSASGNGQMAGDIFIIMGAICYSVYLICVRPLMAKYKGAHILQWIFLFGAFASLPLGWNALSRVSWSAFNGMSWFAIGYIILGATFIAYQLMNYGVSILGASVTGSYIYTQPFFATAASMLILHESLNVTKITAAVLIMAGVFLTNYKKPGIAA